MSAEPAQRHAKTFAAYSSLMQPTRTPLAALLALLNTAAHHVWPSSAARTSSPFCQAMSSWLTLTILPCCNLRCCFQRNAQIPASSSVGEGSDAGRAPPPSSRDSSLQGVRLGKIGSCCISGSATFCPRLGRGRASFEGATLAACAAPEYISARRQEHLNMVLACARALSKVPVAKDKKRRQMTPRSLYLRREWPAQSQRLAATLTQG